MKTDFNLYTISRSEFAKQIGKTRDSVKKDMRRGKYKDLYIFDGKEYKFKSQERDGVNKVLSPIGLSPLKVKKKVNRGAHLNGAAKYKSTALQRRNSIAIILAEQGKITSEDKSLVPEVLAEIKARKQKQKFDSVARSSSLPPRFTNYGGMLSGQELNRLKYEPTNRGARSKKKDYY